jgi:hypothetical protein
MSSLDAPFPSTWTVRRARDAYLAENGFTVEAYDARWSEGTFLGIPLAVPNTRRHRWLIMLHDLHHAACGYGTDAIGEGEIAAWELAHGPRGLGLYVGSIVAGAVIFFGPIAPRRTLAAFRAANGTRSLSALRAAGPSRAWGAAYAKGLGLRVVERRAHPGIPPSFS